MMLRKVLIDGAVKRRRRPNSSIPIDRNTSNPYLSSLLICHEVLDGKEDNAKLSPHCSSLSCIPPCAVNGVPAVGERFYTTTSTVTTHAGRGRTPSSAGRIIISPSFPSSNHHIKSYHHHPPQHIQKRNAVFVSKHNSLNVTASQIINVCQHHGLSPTEDIRQTPNHIILKECPFCHKPTRGKADNMYKCYVAIHSGAYFCHRCGAKGSWYDFKMKLGGYNVYDLSGRSDQQVSGKQFRHQQRQLDHRHIGDNMASEASWNTDDQNTRNASSCLPMPSERLAATYITNLVDNDKLDMNQNKSLQYLLNERKLNTKTLRKYGVGRATYSFPSKKGKGYENKECITFPWIMRATEVAEQEQLRGAFYEWRGNELMEENNRSLSDNDDEEEKEVKDDDKNMSTKEKEDQDERETILREKGPWKTRRIKARSIDDKSQQRLDPPGGGWGLFGWHTVPDNATSVVITEGEYDAMAVYQATGRPAISLPNGCRSLPVQVLPMLEKFEKIYLWMDHDGPGQEGAEQFAKKIGTKRCFIVQPPANNDTDQPLPKDANDALRQNLDLNAIIENAEVVPHERILTFSSLRNQVLHEITNPEKYVGVPMQSLPTFTSYVKGFRRGEMTVLTGPTGSGKTTFLGQLSLDLTEQGVNTLWGSFEIKNTRLIHKLLQQFSRQPLPMGKTDKLSYLEALADRFESLPLYFMKFHGGSEVDDVLDAMDYAAYAHDVQHVILDNMQFMITRNNIGRWGGNNYSGSHFDKFDMQDIAIEKFRKFATERNIHLTLVVHPRKEDENAKLGISSIYGSAKATQEADTVLILQKEGSKKYIDVRKNRFDGTLGQCPLFFQRKSGRYAEQLEVGATAANVEKEKTKNKPVIPPAVSDVVEKVEPTTKMQQKSDYPRTAYDGYLEQFGENDKKS